MVVNQYRQELSEWEDRVAEGETAPIEYVSDPDDLEEENIMKKAEVRSNINYIIRVKAVEEPEFKFLRTAQKVEIQQVYGGEGIQVGDTIEVMVSGNALFFEDEESTTQSHINVGFANKMEVGKDYLVFLNRKLVSLDNSEIIYVSPEMIFTGIFAYEEKENKIVDSITESGHFAKYTDVKDNEFFAASEEALNYLLDLKKELIEKYPMD